MPTLLIVGGGLFGSLAAAYARRRGIEAQVFDPGLVGAASPAAAGLFKHAWAGSKLEEHFRRGLAVLEQLYEVRSISMSHDDGGTESFLFVPPSSILEAHPVRSAVTAIGDGWLETAEGRYEGWVYVAAGIWSNQFLPGLNVYSKAGSAFVFTRERPAKIRMLTPRRQAYAFVRDAGFTYFSDGTAEREYTPDHDRQSLARAADLGLTGPPAMRLWGCRPYVAKGPVCARMSHRSWLATGARKMGLILGASFASRLVDEELR
jgi:glycine/D-amino acid oxidase-like deaminating enzyme